jgi:hypothetical protein
MSSFHSVGWGHGYRDIYDDVPEAYCRDWGSHYSDFNDAGKYYCVETHVDGRCVRDLRKNQFFFIYLECTFEVKGIEHIINFELYDEDKGNEDDLIGVLLLY